MPVNFLRLFCSHFLFIYYFLLHFYNFFHLLTRITFFWTYFLYISYLLIRFTTFDLVLLFRKPYGLDFYYFQLFLYYLEILVFQCIIFNIVRSMFLLFRFNSCLYSSVSLTIILHTWVTLEDLS